MEPSEDRKTKYTAKFILDNGKMKTVRFGGKEGARDYIYWSQTTKKQYADNMKKNYIARHSVNENFDNPISRGALSRWILWNKPTFEASLKDYVKRFDL